MSLTDRKPSDTHAELGSAAPAIFAVLTRQEIQDLLTTALHDPEKIESVEALGELLKEATRHEIKIPFDEHVNPAVFDALLVSSMYSSTKMRLLEDVFENQWVVMSDAQKNSFIDFCNKTFGGEELLVEVAGHAQHLSDGQLKRLLLSPYTAVRHLACENAIVGGKELVDGLERKVDFPFRRSPSDFAQFLCMEPGEFSAVRISLEQSMEHAR